MRTIGKNGCVPIQSVLLVAVRAIGVGAGPASYGSSATGETSGGNQFLRRRRETSFTSKEKKMAVDFWEKSLLRKLPTAAEKSNFRHYTKLEEEERLEEQRKDNERIQRRNDASPRPSKYPYPQEIPTERRNLKQDINSMYGEDSMSSEEKHDNALRQKIIQCLVKAERRIKFAADYGSSGIMALLNDGEMFLREGEELLVEKKWMTSDMQARIDGLRKHAEDTKFDNDID